MQQYVLQYVQQTRRLILQVILLIVLLFSQENATKVYHVVSSEGFPLLFRQRAFFFFVGILCVSRSHDAILDGQL